jgi:hypothetical protein
LASIAAILETAIEAGPLPVNLPTFAARWEGMASDPGFRLHLESGRTPDLGRQIMSQTFQVDGEPTVQLLLDDQDRIGPAGVFWFPEDSDLEAIRPILHLTVAATTGMPLDDAATLVDSVVPISGIPVDMDREALRDPYLVRFVVESEPFHNTRRAALVVSHA